VRVGSQEKTAKRSDTSIRVFGGRLGFDFIWSQRAVPSPDTKLPGRVVDVSIGSRR
jgi:hypothetical protein